MAEYQVLARKYRPQQFKEVIGQDAIVSTLLNALHRKKVAHAYLFCGTRGTGKTSLARLLAKALNCLTESDTCEPCNTCASCLEIVSGHSMDVIEIDGASHRGIEDIRQINETVAFAPTRGKYKIYIIDEVHMLTKEAFNALLKTLEEPPQKVKFFFATTEVHKVPLTILSRCQRFNLKRIPKEAIEKKLKSVAKDLSFSLEDAAAEVIAHYCEGSLRDAQSLLDQTLAFAKDQTITIDTAIQALGLFPKELFFELAQAGKKGDYAPAFSLASKVFASGAYLPHFLEELTLHFRSLLLTLTGAISDARYQAIAPCYNEEQCLDILEMLCEAQKELKLALSEQVAIEMLLLRILRSHQKISTEHLVRKLADIQNAVSNSKPIPPAENVYKQATFPSTPTPLPSTSKIEVVAPEKPKKSLPQPPEPKNSPSLTEDEKKREQNRHDTIMRFAAKELDGSLKKE